MNAPALCGADPRPDGCTDRFGTAKVITLGSSGELLQQRSIHTHRYHFARAFPYWTATTPAQLLGWVSTLSLVGPRLDHRVGDRYAVDLLVIHI